MPAPPPSVNTVSNCGRVIVCCSRTTSSGQSTSFHDPMNVKIATMASTGRASGQKIVKRMRSSPMPSMRAESISDCGICRKNWRSIRIRRGVEQVRNDQRGIGVDPSELDDQGVERNQCELTRHQQHGHRRRVQSPPSGKRQSRHGIGGHRTQHEDCDGDRAGDEHAVEKRPAERRPAPHDAVVLERDRVRHQRQGADLEWRLQRARRPSRETDR